MSKPMDVKCQLMNNLKTVGELEEQIKFLYKNCKSMIGFPLVGELPEDKDQIFTKEEIMNQSIEVTEKWIAILQNFHFQMTKIHESVQKNIHRYRNEDVVALEKVKLGVGFDTSKTNRKIKID